jgi:peptide-methionine (S)-S-oxide reductase
MMGNSGSSLTSSVSKTTAKDFDPVPGKEVAAFGAGCFWGTEKAFKRKFGDQMLVHVGYCGGTGKANYRDVCNGKTGHAEAVQIIYDPNVTTFPEIVDFLYVSLFGFFFFRL